MDEHQHSSQYNYHGMNITLPANIVYIFSWNLGVLAIFGATLIIYIGAFSKIPEELYRCLALQHITSGCLHVMCLTFYNQNFDIPYLDDILEDGYSTLDLITTFTTACLSWIVFLRVFLFSNGEELYSLSQLTIFSSLSLAVIEAYEWLMSLVEAASSLLEALRLTSVLLIMSVPIVVLILLVKSLLSSSSDVPKFQALFFIAYLFMFISSDVVLLMFNLHCNSSFVSVWSIFLYLRLFGEIILYIVFDRYLSHFFVY